MHCWSFDVVGAQGAEFNGLEAGACDGTEANECFCAICRRLRRCSRTNESKVSAVEPENGKRRWVQVVKKITNKYDLRPLRHPCVAIFEFYGNPDTATDPYHLQYLTAAWNWS